MGCFQGSVLGPTLWIMLFDSFLRMGLLEGYCSFTYADDGLSLVAADLTRYFEDRVSRALNCIINWSDNKLHNR